MTVDHRQWAREAIRIIEADFQRSADTHLIPLETPGLPGVELYFKDESSHPTGSLKHRLARSLFLYALCNGWLRPAAPVIEASSGSTAISEAYFARLLGLPFIAVMPASTSKEKIAQIAFYGGQSHLVEDPTQIYAESERLARESGGHFMDQFTYAERATDWRANNNIAESIFQQMRHEPYPTPTWLISSPGTGGTLATLGRYVRYRQHCTRVLCADAERSVFFDAYVSGGRPGARQRVAGGGAGPTGRRRHRGCLYRSSRREPGVGGNDAQGRLRRAGNLRRSGAATERLGALDSVPSQSFPPAQSRAMSFIRLKVRAAFMVHGYDADNREIVEQIGEERFVEKLLRIERIQSISEKYLLVSASHGRVAYWEYEGGLTALRRRLEQAGLLL